MAKAGIHPDYHKIEVIMTDGSKFETRSTYGKDGTSLKLDIDSKTHPAWVGGRSTLNEKDSRVSDFKKKFGGLSFMSGEAPKEETK